MKIEDFERLAADDEHRRLELKKTTGELKDAMHSAYTLLNTDGGWLTFGVVALDGQERHCIPLSSHATSSPSLSTVRRAYIVKRDDGQNGGKQ